LKGLVLARSAVVEVATAALTYWVPPFKIASLFAGGLPPFCGCFIAHNHAGALGAANNNLFTRRGITFTNT